MIHYRLATDLKPKDRKKSLAKFKSNVERQLVELEENNKLVRQVLQALIECKGNELFDSTLFYFEFDDNFLKKSNIIRHEDDIKAPFVTLDAPLAKVIRECAGPLLGVFGEGYEKHIRERIAKELLQLKPYEIVFQANFDDSGTLYDDYRMDWRIEELLSTTITEKDIDSRIEEMMGEITGNAIFEECEILHMIPLFTASELLDSEHKEHGQYCVANEFIDSKTRYTEYRRTIKECIKYLKLLNVDEKYIEDIIGVDKSMGELKYDYVELLLQRLKDGDFRTTYEYWSDELENDFMVEIKKMMYLATASTILALGVGGKNLWSLYIDSGNE